MIHQSGLASPGAGRKARWREIRRSELVTVPFFSPQPRAGKRIWANRLVSVSCITSDTMTSGQAARAWHTAWLSGSDTAGLVPMIHTAFTSPRAIASNSSTAIRPGVCASRSVPQKRATRERSSGSKFMCAASWFASPPTSRPPMAFGCPVSENGPQPGRLNFPLVRCTLMMALHLSLPLEDWLIPMV